MSSMHVKIMQALQDNYMYMIIDTSTSEAAIVDPVEAETVINVVESEKLRLTKVLTHWDHAGGNEKLVKLYTSRKLEVYGGDSRIGALNRLVNQDYTFKIGALDVRCLFTPCHTSGHICYYVKAPSGQHAVFTGDTLFQGGCGRFFEGNAVQMYDALCKKLATLPDETRVFCGHEYTLDNMAFARHVEPKNKAVLRRLEWAKRRHAKLMPTVPSTIAQEKSWNPFMRVHETSVQKHVGQHDPVSTMDHLRKEKDDFKA